jgi:bifunctional polynucleotide phosphatase/kinase
MKKYFDKSIYVLNFGFNPTGKGYKKIRAFDLDSTLIETQSGNRFPKNANDYLWCKGVLDKLHSLTQEGYGLVVFSNQSGISSKNGSKLKMLVEKIGMLAKDLSVTESKVPPQIVFFLAAKEDWNRKPSPGMWSLFINHYNNKVVPEDAMFIGDAAGRPNDFACSDRKFARNVPGLKFQTPEQYFQNAEPEDFEWGGFDPQSILKFPPQPLGITGVPSKTPELLICVGYPGAGKSTWYTTSGCDKEGYIRINQDTLKTPGQCKKVCRDSLKSGKSVYLDNTNISAKNRKVYIDIAKELKIPVRCVWFTASIELCKHLNKCRGYLKHTSVIPHIAYNMAQKNFVEPNVNEGFTEIIQVPFIPDFKSDRELRIFKFRF